jgi:transaldolase
MRFFFDTADITYIENLWQQLEPNINNSDVAGITTNPNAFSKINANSLKDWQESTLKLCKLVSSIRGDDKGVVYVQVPNSSMKKNEVIQWANRIIDWSDGKTKIGMKIAPFVEMLELNDELKDKIDLNVTGTADCSTALLALSYGVRYVSIIPGRMEEKGINAKNQIAFINQRKKDTSEIITGSMRTLEGLKWAFEYDTIPTIGTRVWDLIIENDEYKNFIANPNEIENIQFSPQIDAKMTNLSESFFHEMDKLGSKIYNEIKK